MRFSAARGRPASGGGIRRPCSLRCRMPSWVCQRLQLVFHFSFFLGVHHGCIFSVWLVACRRLRLCAVLGGAWSHVAACLGSSRLRAHLQPLCSGAVVSPPLAQQSVVAVWSFAGIHPASRRPCCALGLPVPSHLGSLAPLGSLAVLPPLRGIAGQPRRLAPAVISPAYHCCFSYLFFVSIKTLKTVTVFYLHFVQVNQVSA